VTELTQPLATAPTEVKKAHERTATPPHLATFSEVVYAHFEWWHALRKHTLDPAGAAAYHSTLTAFERRHGEIVSAYWCSNVESAVALTQKKAGRSRWASPVSSFHRESDWATQHSPDIARELHRCDELAVRAKTVLTGVRQLICMQLVMAAASHLLSLVDRRAAHPDEAKNAVALEHERAALARAEEYYRDAANGQAQVIYFAGMAAVALVIAVFGAVWLSLSWAAPVAALVAGALGAVVSVIQRINAGKFTLDYDVGRRYAIFLGGLRPLIGGAFAMVIAFAFDGGLLHLPAATGGDPVPSRRLALLVVSFLAGFSERWAQDTLAVAVPSMAEKDKPAKPEKPAKPA
jgi:hypothetical protein